MAFKLDNNQSVIPLLFPHKSCARPWLYSGDFSKFLSFITILLTVGGFNLITLDVHFSLFKSEMNGNDEEAIMHSKNQFQMCKLVYL